MWLANSKDAGNWPFCLTFVHGVDVEEVFRGFGADLAHVRSAVPGIPFPDPNAPPQVLGRQSGDWTTVLDYGMPPRGLRPEVLRTVSATSEAVSIYNDIAKLSHEFVHAYNGEIVTAVTASIPPHWRGSQPDRLRPLAEDLCEAFDVGDTPSLEVLLALAEGVFGLSLDPEDLRVPWRAAPLP
jgi:hypothetical protein